MGDFERTFGAGANLDSIIGGFNRDHFREQRSTRSSSTPRKKNFQDVSGGQCLGEEQSGTFFWAGAWYG